MFHEDLSLFTAADQLFKNVITAADQQKENAITAADQLMDKVIYRTTYKNLYLFKKTLLETGQLVMAANVPVKVENRNATSQ